MAWESVAARTMIAATPRRALKPIIFTGRRSGRRRQSWSRPFTIVSYRPNDGSARHGWPEAFGLLSRADEEVLVRRLLTRHHREAAALCWRTMPTLRGDVVVLVLERLSVQRRIGGRNISAARHGDDAKAVLDRKMRAPDTPYVTRTHPTYPSGRRYRSPGRQQPKADGRIMTVSVSATRQHAIFQGPRRSHGVIIAQRIR